MDKRRKVTIRASNKLLKDIKKSTGKSVCRAFLKSVQAPRRTFCSDNCVHEWKLRNNSTYLRQYVYERDLGKCAECRLDTRYLKIEYEDLVHELRGTCLDYQHNSKYVAWLSERRMTHKEALKSFWHADHIIAVFQGGGDGGLANIQTLCVKCHKERTRLQTSKRKKKTLTPL